MQESFKFSEKEEKPLDSQNIQELSVEQQQKQLLLAVKENEIRFDKFTAENEYYQRKALMADTASNVASLVPAVGSSLSGEIGLHSTYYWHQASKTFTPTITSETFLHYGKAMQDDVFVGKLILHSKAMDQEAFSQVIYSAHKNLRERLDRHEITIEEHNEKVSALEKKSAEFQTLQKKHHEQLIFLENEGKKRINALHKSVNLQGAEIKNLKKEQLIQFALLARQNEGLASTLHAIEDQITAQEKQKLVQYTYQSAIATTQYMTKIGVELNSPGLQKIGALGNQVVELQHSLADLSKSALLPGAGGVATSLSGGLLPVTQIFSSIMPYFAIASAVFQIVSVFRKRKKKGDDGMGEALQAIMQQIKALHQEMRQSFQQVFHNQAILLEVMEKMFNYLQHEVNYPIQHKLDEIKNLLVLVQKFNQQKELTAEYQQLETLFNSIESAIKLRTLDFHGYIDPLSDKFLVAAFNPTINGQLALTLAVNQNQEFFHQLVGDMKLFDFHDYQLAVIGAVYANEKNPGGKLPNPYIFFTALKKYLELYANPEAIKILGDRAGQTNALVLSAMEHHLNKALKHLDEMKIFLQTLHQDEAFFARILKDYKKALLAMEKHINTKLAKLNINTNKLTVSQMFNTPGSEQENYVNLLSQLNYFQGLFFNTALLAGKWQEFLAYYELSHSRELVNNHVVLSINKVTEAQAWENLPAMPEYLYTIQLGKFKQQGETWLYMAVRSPRGIDLQLYDPVVDQWKAAPRLPVWSDASGNNKPQYYETLRSTVLSLNGQDHLYFSLRTAFGLELYSYVPEEETWLPHQPTNPILADSGGWSLEKYYPTFQIKPLVLNNQIQLALVARESAGAYPRTYDPLQDKWEYNYFDCGAFSDASGWQHLSQATTAFMHIFNQTQIIYGLYSTNSHARWTPYITHFNLPAKTWYGIHYDDSNKILAENASTWNNPYNYLFSKKVEEAIELQGIPHLFFTAKRDKGIIVYRYLPQNQIINQGYHPSLWEASSFNEIFSKANGFDREERYLSLRATAIKLGNVPKVLISGFGEEGLLLYAVDAQSMEWQQLPTISYYELFDLSAAATKDEIKDDIVAKQKATALGIRMMGLELNDGIEELIILMPDQGLRLLRIPLNVHSLKEQLDPVRLKEKNRSSVIASNQTFSMLADTIEEFEHNITQAISDPAREIPSPSSIEEEVTCVQAEDGKETCGKRISRKLLSLEEEMDENFSLMPIQPAHNDGATLLPWTYYRPALPSLSEMKIKSENALSTSDLPTSFSGKPAYAPKNCQLMADISITGDAVPVLVCEESTYDVHVYPHTENKPETPITHDDYIQSSCVGIGETEVVCEGEHTSAKFSLKLPEPPLAGIDGQIMLGAVGLFWLKKAWNYAHTEPRCEEKINFEKVIEESQEISSVEKSTCLQTAADRLDVLEEKLQTLQKQIGKTEQQQIKGLLWAIESRREDIEALAQQLEISQLVLDELNKDIDAIEEDSLEHPWSQTQAVVQVPVKGSLAFFGLFAVSPRQRVTQEQTASAVSYACQQGGAGDVSRSLRSK